MLLIAVSAMRIRTIFLISQVGILEIICSESFSVHVGKPGFGFEITCIHFSCYPLEKCFLLSIKDPIGYLAFPDTNCCKEIVGGRGMFADWLNFLVFLTVTIHI